MGNGNGKLQLRKDTRALASLDIPFILFFEDIMEYNAILIDYPKDVLYLLGNADLIFPRFSTFQHAFPKESFTWRVVVLTVINSSPGTCFNCCCLGLAGSKLPARNLIATAQ